MFIKDILLTEFDREVGATRRLLDRVPDDKLAWRPHVRSRTLGELATHLAMIPRWGARILNEFSYDLSAAAAQVEAMHSQREILEAFTEAARDTRAVMDRSDAEYLAMWTLKREGRDLYSVPRMVVFRSFVVNHAIHHRGQLTVYLRLNDVPLPPLYGPTADEG